MLILAKNTQKKIKTSKVYTLCKKKKILFFKENFQESVNLRIRNFEKLMVNLENNGF